MSKEAPLPTELTPAPPVVAPESQRLRSRIAIFGGLILSQILTLYTTPVIYLLIDRLRRRREPSGVHAPAE